MTSAEPHNTPGHSREVEETLIAATIQAGADPDRPPRRPVAWGLGARAAVATYLAATAPDRAALGAAAGLSVDDPIAATASDDELRFLAALRQRR